MRQCAAQALLLQPHAHQLFCQHLRLHHAEKVAGERDMLDDAVVGGQMRLHTAAGGEALLPSHLAFPGLAIVPFPRGVPLLPQPSDLRFVLLGKDILLAGLLRQNVVQQHAAKFLQLHGMGHMLPHGGDAASDGGHALGGDLFLVHMKGLRHPVQIRIEHDGTVVHDPTLLQILGVAGEFLTVDGHVVPPIDLGLNAQSRQRSHHRLTEQLEVDGFHAAGIGDKREVQVSHVVVHRSAAGQPPYHSHTVFPDELLVDLGGGVLVLADNDGVVILPQHEIGAVPRERVKHIVATGSVNAQPPIPGLKENPNCIDSTGALSLDKLPATMVVIGGGVIGLELACAYAAFGTKITVVEAMDHMLPMLDGDLTKIGVAHMKKMGMDFHLECPVQSVESSPVGAKVVCRDKSGNTVSFEAEKVLVAIGRRANTAELDLAAGKIDNDKGRILVNDKMETSVSGVYAIGDCVFGHAQLAHTASAMGEAAAENICGHEAHYCEKTNPTCVYMEPEAASVGLTEEQCKAQGIAYKVGKFPMSANGKALILNGGEGLVKIIAGAEYGEILGMHIIGPRATDLIAEGALAIGGEMTLDELIDTIHSHPTVTETMREAALNAEKRAIHTKN